MCGKSGFRAQCGAENNADFCGNILAKAAAIDYHRAIGANMSRLHGFHRFLPHLWELFLLGGQRAGSSATPQGPLRLRPCWHF